VGRARLRRSRRPVRPAHSFRDVGGAHVSIVNDFLWHGASVPRFRSLPAATGCIAASQQWSCRDRIELTSRPGTPRRADADGTRAGLGPPSVLEHVDDGKVSVLTAQVKGSRSTNDATSRWVASRSRRPADDFPA
jgi:hypothetical protein